MTMQATSQPQAHASIKVAGQISDVAVPLLLGLGVALLHILANGQYGFHRGVVVVLVGLMARDTGLFGCTEPRQPWPAMWSDMQWFQ